MRKLSEKETAGKKTNKRKDITRRQNKKMTNELNNSNNDYKSNHYDKISADNPHAAAIFAFGRSSFKCRSLSCCSIAGVGAPII